MTDERLNQILKQALAPEIDDSEIKVRRKVRNSTMNMKKIVAAGLVACATLILVVSGGHFGNISNTGEDRNVGVNDERDTTSGNLFAITAYAAELPEGVSSGDVMAVSAVATGYGSAAYLDGRFAISGQNIEKVKIITDKCNLYSAIPVYKGDANFEKAENDAMNGGGEYVLITDVGIDYDEENATGPVPYHYEHLRIVGDTYEDVYNENMLFGMSVPKELWSTNSDMQVAAHEDIDKVNGAILTIEVTFSDGSTETHHYRLNTGKIFVPTDASGILQWDNLTRFITPEEEQGEVGYAYGYLMEKID